MVLELLYLCLSIPCGFSLNLICKFCKEPSITSITTKQEEKKYQVFYQKENTRQDITYTIGLQFPVTNSEILKSENLVFPVVTKTDLNYVKLSTAVQFIQVTVSDLLLHKH